MSPKQRPLTTHDTQQEINIHALGGIRTYNPSERSAADPRFRPHGHWVRPTELVISGSVLVEFSREIVVNVIVEFGALTC